MTLIQRAKASLIRKPVKTLILFMLVLILASVSASAIIVSQVIHITTDYLRFNNPTVVTLRLDDDALQAVYSQEALDTGAAWSYFLAINREAVQALAQYPYIRNFDYSVQWYGWSFLEGYTPNLPSSYGSITAEEGKNYFGLTGVERTEMIQLENGLLTLIEGRTFTDLEMNPLADDQPTPVLIPAEIAELNHLTIGSVFNLYDQIFSLPEHAHVPEGGIQWSELEELWEHPYNNWTYEATVELKVIGIFDIDHHPATHLNDFHTQMMLYNTFFIPNWVIEPIRIQEYETRQEWASVFNFSEFLGGLDELENVTAFFVLENAADIEPFTEAVHQVLSEFHTVEDGTHVFAPLESAMSTLNGMSLQILIFSIGATLLILSLLITLFLHDRRHELGVYLALGEKKSKIISQLLIEVLSVSLIAVTLAIFVGNIIATQASGGMLRNELIAATTPNAPSDAFTMPSNLESFGLIRELTVDELIAFFEVSLDRQTIVLFYVIGTVSVMLSTLVPIVYVLDLKPKTILMQGKIG